MTLDEIRELIQLVSETGVAELEVQRGDNRVRIRLSVPGEGQAQPVTMFHAAPAIVPPEQKAVSAASGSGNAPAAGTTPQPDAGTVLVKSPIVGTYYESASPGSPAFVRVGEKVAPGKVLCIIESMKLMNEIEADVAGILESKLVPNGQPVEYGEALFAIRPV
ncbi:MAG: acetyl-CoA carboxylase biotin carboxyl carrier protein [Acidobacteriota bacterium]|nr:acetyl-CoA carboxylase biotin carboxyl carrier protein [Acidobacteriota bacterium]